MANAVKVLTPEDGVPVVHIGRHSGELSHPHLIPEYKGNETILLVDDESMLRDLLTFALERYGYNVLVAVDGEDAIELADQYKAPIHLVLSDVVMPRLDGCRRHVDSRAMVGAELRRITSRPPQDTAPTLPPVYDLASSTSRQTALPTVSRRISRRWLRPWRYRGAPARSRARTTAST